MAGPDRLASCTGVQAYRGRMDLLTAQPGEPGWVDASACILPTAERPTRLAEFDDLFASSLVAIEARGDTRARLVLSADPGIADRTRRLTDAETACCSFFGFEVTAVGPGSVTLDIEVPEAYADVLAGLLARARAALGAGS